MLKANPGKYNYASRRQRTPSHLSAELFKTMAGVDTQHIPYQGVGPAMVDVLQAGPDHVRQSSYIVGLYQERQVARAWRDDARGRAIVPGHARRSPSRLPGYETYRWNALFAPSTPPEIVAKLNAAANRALATPKVRRALSSSVSIPGWLDARELREHVQRKSPNGRAHREGVGRPTGLVYSRHCRLKITSNSCGVCPTARASRSSLFGDCRPLDRKQMSRHPFHMKQPAPPCPLRPLPRQRLAASCSRRPFGAASRRVLWAGEGFAVDASLIKADANKQRSAEGSETVDWAALAETRRSVREYLDTLDEAAWGAASEVKPKFVSSPIRRHNGPAP